MSRRGFTLVELMVVVLIIGILANLTLPLVTTLSRKADATHVVADFKAVRVAAFDYYAANSNYPPSGAWGQVPPPLAASLPAGFAFTYKDAEYCWFRYSLPNGMPTNASQTTLLALGVRSSDARFLNAIRSAYGGQLVYGGAGEVDLVIE